MNSDAAELLQTVVWPGAAVVFLLTGVACAFGKKWLFASSLLCVGILLAGSWQYNRTHEEISTLQLFLVEHKLVKANVRKPEESVYEVLVTGMERGTWRANLRAADIRLTKPSQIVLVELRKRPLTGTYVKSVADQPAK